MIYKGYAKANNKFLKSYDPNKPILYILYLDAVNSLGLGYSRKIQPK